MINNLLDIEESFHASYRIMELLNDRKQLEETFEKFLEHETDLSFDWFTEYFQSEHSDRKGKKQDFTPDGIIKVASGVLGHSDSNADICAGTGGLTIKRYAENPNTFFYCEEYSDRALPFLLFNLAIRNVDSLVVHGDSLTRETKAIYKLVKSEKYSLIELDTEIPEGMYGTVIMNPPYSLSWEPEATWINQPRFADYGALAPRSKADYAFLLQGLSFLSEYGTMSIVLPHGVLFRGGAEGTIRQALIKNNLIDAIIGLPEKAFFNTDIPTCLLILKKNRENNDILFIDASKEFTKVKSNNMLDQSHVEKILSVYSHRLVVDKFSFKATIQDIQDNDFNLNIPRYVDTYVEEPVTPLSEIISELESLDSEIAENQKAFSGMLNNLVGTNPIDDQEIKSFAAYFGKRVKAGD